MSALRAWFGNVFTAIKTVAEGMYVTLWYFVQTYRRQTFTERFEYPELPVPVKPRYRGFHRFDLTTCIGCDKCARACPVDCIYMGSTYDQSTFSRDGCIIDFAALPLEVAWGQATLSPTAVAESKKVALPVWMKKPEPPPSPKPEMTPPAPTA